MSDNRVKIAIVGAGPVGLAAAILLRIRGVDAVVFERREDLCLYPQAHVINTRTAEILREIGLFEAAVDIAAPLSKMGFVTWSDSLSGRRFGRLPYQGDAEQLALREQMSPARTLNIAQDRFERLLYKHLIDLGGDVRFGHAVCAAAVVDGKAVLTVDGLGGQREAIFDYVLACDGANSTVRQSIGIEMEGPSSIARFASAYFTADLQPYLGGDMGPVNFIAGPDAKGVIIGFDLATTWAFMCVMPPDADPADFDLPVMGELIRRAVGDPELAFEITSIGTWNMSAQVASRFRHGPLMLVGDAAHRFPPTGGLGLNTGVGDAHNLAWKLGMIARGEAGAALLDSYEPERKPVACRNRDHSVSNAMRMAEVDQAIGAAALGAVDPAAAARPALVQATHPVDGDGAVAQAARANIQARIDDQRPHFDSLMLEIGYTYNAEDRSADGAAFEPVVAVGRRLPHAWIFSEGRRFSTMDLIERDQLTLFVGANADQWAAAVNAPERLPVEVRSTAEFIGQLETNAGLRDALKGAVLVRPDGHIAWMGTGDFDLDAWHRLERAVVDLVCTESLRSPHGAVHSY